MSAHELMKMTVAFAAWVGVGCLFGALVVDTPGASVAYLWFATGFCVVAGAAGLAVVRHLDEKGTLRVGVAMIIGAGVVTSVGVYYLGPLAPIAALVWVGEAILVRLADLKLHTRGVWWHTLAVSVALAVILAIQPGNDVPAAQWLAVVGTLLLVTFVGSWLVERLEALATAEQTATHAAARAAAELESASRHKSQFLAGMSHELRTPLNAVIGFAEALQRELAGPLTDHQREYVDDIVASGRHLLGLINDVLDLAKLDAGRLELTPRTLEVVGVVEQAVGAVDSAAEAKGVLLEVDVVPGVEVPADEGRLTQAVAALVSNAVRFTPPGGAVTVRARSDGDAVRLVVSDTGPGLGEVDSETIFEPFHRGTADPSRAAEGSDLGLALARRLVELHGGTLTADSAPGEGAVFTAVVPTRFPLPGAALDDDAPLVSEAT